MISFPTTWRFGEAKDLCSELVDCINKTAPVVEYETPYKMIRTTNVKKGRVDLTEAKCVDEATFIKWNRRLTPKYRDIVLTREAPLGDVGLIRTDEKVFLGQRTMLFRANPDLLDQHFLYYTLLGPTAQAQIRTFGSGSTVEHVRVPDAEKITIPYPDLATQRKIAAILTAYDDLIEVNKRRIALLEKMAEELYREWFVRLRFPGYQNTRFVKGVPEGWEMRRFTDLVEMNPSEILPTSETVPFVGMECLSQSSMHFSWKEQRTASSGSKFRNRDTLFPRITPCLENGKRGFVSCLHDDQIAVGSTEFIVFREKALPAEYIYLLSCNNSFRQHAELSMTGASGRQRVQNDCFGYFFIPAPPPGLLRRFTDVVRPMFNSVSVYAEEIENLTKTRDLLLPRLISGKLSVEDLDIHFPPSMQEGPVEQESPPEARRA